MSPDPSWKVSLPCTRAEAEAIREDIPALALLDEPPVLMTSEADAAQPDKWRLDAYFESKPKRADLELLQSLVPSATGEQPRIEKLAEEDWVTASQRGLEPIRAGRFFVHTPAHRGGAPGDAIAFEIDAGRAFGTGHHETTMGCLIALDRMKRSGIRFANILDLGTGTGLLAFAALALWPAAKAVASDVDPVSVEVTEENARLNGVRLGRARGQVELTVAAGLDHQRLKARTPYDLIVANILAGPLIELAPAVAAAIEPGGRLVLAGLMGGQAERVAASYRREGMMLEAREDRGEWPILVMRKRRRTAPIRRRSRRVAGA